jgi:FkbM family methyltransferase
MKLRETAVTIAVATARRLPVRWLRLANQRLHQTRWGRHVLGLVWNSVANEAAVIPRGPLNGWTFVTGGSQPAYLLGASEPDLQNALAASIRPGQVFYDIGANVGFFTLLAARLVTSTGYVYAFEPIEANIRAMRRNIDLNHVRHVDVVCAAVSDTCGTVHMSPGNNQATCHLAYGAEDGLSVPSTTIDAFVSAGHRPPDLVKVDVEGAENLVLSGMRDTLRTRRPIVICELHYDRDDPRRDVITSILQDADYDELMLALDGGLMPHLLATPREAQGIAIRPGQLAPAG